MRVNSQEHYTLTYEDFLKWYWPHKHNPSARQAEAIKNYLTSFNDVVLHWPRQCGRSLMFDALSKALADEKNWHLKKESTARIIK